MNQLYGNYQPSPVFGGGAGGLSHHPRHPVFSGSPFFSGQHHTGATSWPMEGHRGQIDGRRHTIGADPTLADKFSTFMNAQTMGVANKYLVGGALVLGVGYYGYTKGWF